MKIIVLKNDNGSCSLATPELKAMEEGESEVDFLNRAAGEALARNSAHGSISYRITDSTNIPTDYAYRDAFTDDNATDTVDVDMIKAKVIAHNKRRARREEAFTPLDKLATVLIYAVRAEADRQLIRDADAQLQINIDAATTHNELLNIIKQEKIKWEQKERRLAQKTHLQTR